MPNKMNYSITDDKFNSKDMKNNKLVSVLLVSVFMLMLIGSFLLGSSIAHSSRQVVQVDDDEIMIITDGKAMAMSTETMNN